MTSRSDRSPPLTAEFIGGPVDGLRYLARCEERLPHQLHMPCDGTVHLYVARVGESGRVYFMHVGPRVIQGAIK
jgi:hypothetical protein